MSRKNTDHIVLDMRSGNLLCSNCGGTYRIELPVAIDMWAAQGNVFSKRHKACPKTWEPPPRPTVPQHLSAGGRQEWWLAHGERGISSNTMLEVITGHHATGSNGRSHPLDPSDFSRCWRLVTALPELREGFTKLAQESPEWAALVEYWDELAEMMPLVIQEWDTVKRGGDMPTASKMWARMQALGC